MDTHPYTVVVGVSPGSRSPTALTWARAQAALHGGRVVAVRVWRSGQPQATPSGTTATRVPVASDVEADEWTRFSADVHDVLGPDHGVELRLVRGDRRHALLRESRSADLLVIDAPRSLARSPLFAHRLVYAARCPVVVMPPRISGEPESGLGRAGWAAVRAAGSAGRPGLGTRRD